jgi:hypothetical protein
MHLPLVDLVGAVAHRVVGPWAVASQQHARRNAMVAATALTQRRAESREVEDYLASRQVRRPGPGAAATALPR